MTQIIHDSGAIMHTYKFSSNLLPVYKIIGWYGADDILITARTQQTLIDTFGKLKDISSQYGLIVNESKTKYMKCTRRENTLGKLRVGDIQIDQVKSFSYLGSTVNGNNTLEEEIRERIAKGNRAFYANKALFTSKLVSRRSKLKLY